MIDLRLVGGVAVLLCLASTAHAQRGRLVNDGTGFRCEYYDSCEAGGVACETDHCLDSECVNALTLASEYACCGDGAGCPEGSTCDNSGGFDFGICTDEARPTCDHSVAADCFAGTSWDDGDCDGDGIKNVEETAGCECMDARSKESEDVCRPDAGMPMTLRDAGTDDVVDSGPNPFDAGTDAPKPPRADALDYRGSGGCTCDAGSAGSEPMWLLLGIAVLAGRRMRRLR